MKSNLHNFDAQKEIVNLVDELFSRDALSALEELIEAKNEELVDKAIKIAGINIVTNDFGHYRRERIFEAIVEFLSNLQNPHVKIFPKSNRLNSHYHYEIYTLNFKILLSHGRTRNSQYVKANAKECNEKITPKQDDLFPDAIIGQEFTQDNKLLVLLNIEISGKKVNIFFDFPHARDTKIGSSLAKFSISSLLDIYDKMKAETPKPQVPQPRRLKAKKRVGE